MSSHALTTLSACVGADESFQAGGIDDHLQWMGELSTQARGGRPGGCQLWCDITEPPMADAFLERACLLALTCLREPQGASELELAGLWAVLYVSLGGRASLAMVLIEAGMLELAVATLQGRHLFISRGVRTPAPRALRGPFLIRGIYPAHESGWGGRRPTAPIRNLHCEQPRRCSGDPRTQ